MAMLTYYFDYILKGQNKCTQSLTISKILCIILREMKNPFQPLVEIPLTSAVWAHCVCEGDSALVIKINQNYLYF